ncbi:hypothetical protein CASFOL_036586 [Castilleja foliolosa]|uniref:Uncharacterized protein n=1 Tax=Castilleja foliolosa TaxID=1961234 RepID=A0ABD3BWL7_9LAMI
MFMEWMELNKIDPKARELTYSDAPSEFVWDKYAKKWKARQRNMSIGSTPLPGQRMYGVTPGSIYPMIYYTDNVNPFKIQNCG